MASSVAAATHRTLSIAAQRVKLEALAVLNDFQLIDVVVDAGASAKSLDRPGWQRVMGAASTAARSAPC